MALISKEDLLTKFETGALLFQPEVKRIIKIQPEVDAEPVRHGKWIEHKDYPGLAYLCSECGRFTTERSHFCPDCGAKMDGGEE